MGDQIGLRELDGRVGEGTVQDSQILESAEKPGHQLSQSNPCSDFSQNVPPAPWGERQFEVTQRYFSF